MGDWILSTFLALLCILLGLLLLRQPRNPVHLHSTDPTTSLDSIQSRNNAIVDGDTRQINEQSIDRFNAAPRQIPNNASLKKLSRVEYSVGMVTALSKELKAVIAVLDEKHGQPSDFRKPETDANNYIWGQIGDHNVVLVSCPKNMPGKVSAATVAVSLVRTIPSIRFCVMVGIGGGVPYYKKAPDDQVRLGDVVISAPSGTTGGVVQYDIGKVETSNGGSYFRRTGQLSSPPRSLLSVLTTFEGEMDDFRLQLHIESAAANMDNRTKKLSAYPGAADDQLFPTSYAHQLSSPWYSGFRFWTPGRSQLEMGSTDCLHCDRTQTIYRAKRDSPSIPRIHYGLIASGDRVIKDAKERDQIVDWLQRENVGDCLCFEMEAAGLMNVFPCLVIRGISDYADSHKNDRWHHYAAVAAAAVAKELLSSVPLPEVELERPASEVIQEIRQDLEEIKHHTSHLRQKDIHDWLEPAKPSINHNMALKLRHGNTSAWFLEHEAFSSWLSGRNSHLWLHGTSGCGKTVLTSTIIEHLKDECVYFYFDFRDSSKQSLDQALRSLIFQLYCKDGGANRSVKYILEKQLSDHGNGTSQPSTSCLIDTFDHMTRQMDVVRIVMDALDECSTGTATGANLRAELLRWLEERINHRGSERIRFIVTSRSSLTDIELQLKPLLLSGSIFSVENESTRADIRALIQERLRNNKTISSWRTSDGKLYLKHIEEKLLEKSNLMFRWADLQLNKLEKLGSQHAMNKALECLPNGLDEIYARSFEEVLPEHREDAILLLQILLYSKYSVAVGDILFALTIDPHLPAGRCIDPDRRMSNDMKPLLPLMSSLVRKDDGIVRLAHSSVKDFLVSSFHEWQHRFHETSARADLLHHCLAYLGTLEAKDVKDPHPLDFYVQTNLLVHANYPGMEEYAHEHIMKFLTVNAFKRHIDYWRFGSRCFMGPPLCVSAGLGLTWTVNELLKKGVDPNERGDEAMLTAAGGSPYYQGLIAKYVPEHHELFSSKQEESWHYANALCAASAAGHDEIVQLLLDNGAKIEVTLDIDHNDGNPLWDTFNKVSNSATWLDRDGHDTKVAKVLLERWPDDNAKGRHLGLALILACCHYDDDTNLVRLLLDNGADMTMEDDESGSALDAARRNGHYGQAEMLIAAGADVNA